MYFLNDCFATINLYRIKEVKEFECEMLRKRSSELLRGKHKLKKWR